MFQLLVVGLLAAVGSSSAQELQPSDMEPVLAFLSAIIDGHTPLAQVATTNDLARRLRPLLETLPESTSAKDAIWIFVHTMAMRITAQDDSNINEFSLNVVMLLRRKTLSNNSFSPDTQNQIVQFMSTFASSLEDPFVAGVALFLSALDPMIDNVTKNELLATSGNLLTGLVAESELVPDNLKPVAILIVNRIEELPKNLEVCKWYEQLLSDADETRHTQ